MVVAPSVAGSSEYQPMYIVGGFRSGIKMNDIYKLETTNGKQFVWEFIDV